MATNNKKLNFRTARLEDAEALNELINTSFSNTDPGDMYLPGQARAIEPIMDVERVIASINDPTCVVLVVTDPSHPATTTTTPAAPLTFETTRDSPSVPVSPSVSGAAETETETETIIGHAIVHDRDAERAWLSMLAVRPTHQRLGVGAQILGWAEEHARSALKKPRFELNALSSRARLIAWYKSHGYVPTGESTPFVYQYFGDWRGVLRDDLSFVNLGKDL